MTNPAGRFGTFGGVFTPNVLTILGVIMFLRFGQIVGQSGVWNALLIVLAAKLITTLTTVSLSAIATNVRVQGGGAYFIISRSLGPEFGGAIGIVFFLAQAISVAMYIIGFTEAITAAFSQLPFTFTEIATATNIVVFICVFIGAGWTIKLQFGILAILGLSLLSFFIGAGLGFDADRLAANAQPAYTPGQNLFTMFALFFPAATGIMAGANMSGDLKDPAKSIPAGTFGAIAVTGAIYAIMVLLLAGSADGDALRTNNFIVSDVSFIPVLILAGVCAATLSSALGSMMGAPRILQAFARDEIIPSIRFLAKGSGKDREPRRAIIVSFLVAQAAIMLGDLDVIAPIITMFFMVTYGMLNLACFYEGYSRNPSFRPRFRFNHWSASLLGAIGCGVAMLLMAPVWALVAVAAMFALHWYIGRSEIRARWGDVQSGVAFEQARKALLRLEDEFYHPKNWRPNILALSGGAWTRYDLAEVAYWLASSHGVLTLGQVIGGDVEDRITRRNAAIKRLRQFIHDEDLEAFPAVVVEEDLEAGIKSLIQCYGIGGMVPNTVLLGWTTDHDRFAELAPAYRLIRDLGKSLVLVDCHEDRERWVPPTGQIDIWWGGRKNGPLMLLLAHMLVKNREFRDRDIRVISVVGKESGRAGAMEHLQNLINSARIDALAEVFISDDLEGEIKRESATAAFVMLGFDPPEDGETEAFFARYADLLATLDNVILVHNVGGVDLDV